MRPHVPLIKFRGGNFTKGENSIHFVLNASYDVPYKNYPNRINLLVLKKKIGLNIKIHNTLVL